VCGKSTRILNRRDGVVDQDADHHGAGLRGPDRHACSPRHVDVNIMLPPSAVVKVQMVDVSRADAPAVVVGEQLFDVGGESTVSSAR